MQRDIQLNVLKGSFPSDIAFHRNTLSPRSAVLTEITVSGE